MKSIFKSIRVAGEIFGPPLFVTIVMLIYMMRPVGGAKQNPEKTKTRIRSAYSTLGDVEELTGQLRAHKH